MVRAHPDRQLFSDIPIRVNNLIRPVAQKKLGMDIPVRFTDYIFCPQFFDQARNLQAALEISADTDKTDVKIPDAEAS